MFVERRIVPFSPTINPATEPTNSISFRSFVVPLPTVSQLVPASTVRRINPPPPTATPVFKFANLMGRNQICKF